MVRRKLASAARNGITARQWEVLVLMADGYTNAVIAEKLFITANTVASHVISIRRALRARTKAHAVAQALRRDIL